MQFDMLYKFPCVRAEWQAAQGTRLIFRSQYRPRPHTPVVLNHGCQVFSIFAKHTKMLFKRARLIICTLLLHRQTIRPERKTFCDIRRPAFISNRPHIKMEAGRIQAQCISDQTARFSARGFEVFGEVVSSEATMASRTIRSCPPDAALCSDAASYPPLETTRHSPGMYDCQDSLFRLYVASE